MNRTQVKELIKAALNKPEQPLILHSKPGLGKTALIEQIAEEVDCDLIGLNCQQLSLLEFKEHLDSASEGMGEFYDNEKTIFFVENVEPYFFTEGLNQLVPKNWLTIFVDMEVPNNIPNEFLNRCLVINLTE